MANSVVWCEIYVQDMPRAKAFYEKVLGITLEPLGDPSGESEMFAVPMPQDGAGWAIVKMKGMSSGGAGTVVYFGCEDCAVESGRVAAHGGQVIRPKFAIGPYGHVALATDPDGNTIGFHSMK
jgi:hypothetical protein